ncbi:MAG: hypothetical protein HWE23_16955 [Rhodobacteraceae bacterium]|nr:hypothetical protein [Paracoccaceae bacterium]
MLDWPGVTTHGCAGRAGDAWQIAFATPRFALSAALLVQASLRTLDVPKEILDEGTDGRPVVRFVVLAQAGLVTDP